jgi:REP element-mobilizing transposase RayT
MSDDGHQEALRHGRFSQAWGLYYVTKCLQPAARFTPSQSADVVQAFLHGRTQGWLLLHAFVVMPDHWHALLSLQAEKTLPQVVHALCRHASFNSRKLDYPLLRQTGFHDHKIRSGESVVDIVRNIENNPVRKQLVATPAEWAWSSAATNFQDQLDRNFLGHERWVT